MMEWGDKGIKDADDLRGCMEEGARASDLYRAYKDRIGGIIADLLDELWAEKTANTASWVAEREAAKRKHLLTILRDMGIDAGQAIPMEDGSVEVLVQDFNGRQSKIYIPKPLKGKP